MGEEFWAFPNCGDHAGGRTGAARPAPRCRFFAPLVFGSAAQLPGLAAEAEPSTACCPTVLVREACPGRRTGAKSLPGQRLPRPAAPFQSRRWLAAGGIRGRRRHYILALPAGA